MARSNNSRSRLLLSIAVGVAMLGGAAVAQAAPAAAPTSTSFAFTSQPGDYIGGGQSGRYTAVSVSGSAGDVTVQTPGSGFLGNYSVELAAAPGHALHPGDYVNATRAPFRAAGSPGIDVIGGDRGCNEAFGSFTIISIETAPTGAITEFSANFVSHCESPDAPAFSGSVRYQAPYPDRVVLTSEQPTSLAGVPVRLDAHVAAGTAGPATGTVAWYDGHTLLGTKPLADGRADLNPAGLAVGVHRITAVYSGDAHLPPAASDPVTQTVVGASSSLAFTGATPLFFTAPAARITVSGTASNLTVAVTEGADWFFVQLAAPVGQTLKPGHYADAQRASFRTGTHPGLDVFGDGVGCNQVTGSFDVASIATAADGSVSHLDATFTDYCDTTTAAPPRWTGRVRVGA